MRKLLYVPIIHTESDLGSAGLAIDARSAALVGRKKWAKHKETVQKFWAHLGHYFGSLDTANLKIYQDGLPADGQLGKKIIEEAARRGSENYQIVLSLMNRGAEVVKTESPSLLIEEYKHAIQVARSGLAKRGTPGRASDESGRDSLMRQRDEFVAKTVDATLNEGETGVLFMGSYHDVLSLLPEDIVVEHLKDRHKINAYFRELTSGRDWGRFEQMANYLSSPI